MDQHILSSHPSFHPWHRTAFVVLSLAVLVVLSGCKGAKDVAPDNQSPAVGNDLVGAAIRIQEGSLKTESHRQVREFEMTVKRYEFDPKVIKVRSGELVRIRLRSLDAQHGFLLEDLGINVIIDEGTEKIIEFTAPKRGIYNFRSPVYSGDGYGSMRGQVIVTD